jgi:hypothetical protein
MTIFHARQLGRHSSKPIVSPEIMLAKQAKTASIQTVVPGNSSCMPSMITILQASWNSDLVSGPRLELLPAQYANHGCHAP